MSLKLETIPLFPLGTTLLPYGRMPLQIFERRYIDLIAQCMREGTGFGVVQLRRGSEVGQGGIDAPDIAAVGCFARIVDWDQLPNQLLGITIEGGERLAIERCWRADSGLVMADAEVGALPEPEPVASRWLGLAQVLEGLHLHPHVQRLGYVETNDNAWAMGWQLAQLLPLEEALKYQLLVAPTLEDLLSPLDQTITQMSGE